MSVTTLPEVEVTATRLPPTPSPVAPAPSATPPAVPAPAAIPAPAYVVRKVDLTFMLAQGSFGQSGFNTIKLSGLRCSATVVIAGAQSMTTLHLTVWGMTLDQMNSLSTLGQQILIDRRNMVMVEAGDAVSGMTKVFTGTIQNAYVDGTSQPDVSFVVEAFVGLTDALKPVPASSFRAPVNVANVMQSFAGAMGYAFENHGVNVTLHDSYFPGTGREQVRACAEAANIDWIIENNSLVIWPKGTARGNDIPVISPDTGMHNYPAFNQQGIIVSVTFNPALAYGMNVKIVSQLSGACGVWQIYALTHQLEAEMPSGQWVSTVMAGHIGAPTVVTSPVSAT